MTWNTYAERSEVLACMLVHRWLQVLKNVEQAASILKKQALQTKSTYSLRARYLKLLLKDKLHTCGATCNQYLALCAQLLPLRTSYVLGVRLPSLWLLYESVHAALRLPSTRSQVPAGTACTVPCWGQSLPLATLLMWIKWEEGRACFPRHHTSARVNQ